MLLRHAELEAMAVNAVQAQEELLLWTLCESLLACRAWA